MCVLMKRFILVIAITLISVAMVNAYGGYPRIANLWGCYPTDPDYDKWAKYDLLVIAGSNDLSWRKFREEMKSHNPEMIILGTASLMNLGSPETTPWMKPEWYLKRPDGGMVKWWADMVYTPNLLIDDCLDALVNQGEKEYGLLLKDKTVDGLMYDSVVGNARWLGDVDIDGDGKLDRSEELDAQWQDRQNQYFDRMKAAHPEMLILANDVDAGHRAHLNGRLFEGATLLDQMFNKYNTPFNIIKTLNTWMESSQQPAITFAIASHPIGWQWWRTGKGDSITTPGEVERVRRDFHRMRLGLITTLMTDAYYYYDVGTVWYGIHMWFAEYDAPLGKPLGKAQEVYKVPPKVVLNWKAGDEPSIFRENIISRADTDGYIGEIPDENSGWNMLISTDPEKVKLQPFKTYRIQADFEIAKKPTGVLQFTTRTAVGGWELHDKGIHLYPGKGKAWHIDTVVVLDDFDDYSAELHIFGAGKVILKNLKITEINNCYIMREFEGGKAILNPNDSPLTVMLDTPMRKLKDESAPLYYLEIDDESADCKVEGSWEKVDGEDHYYGEGFRKARKPGETMRWQVTAPSADTYTVYACNPGDKSYTDSACFTLDGISNPPSKTVNQKKADGGWVELFDVKLQKGQKFDVVLKSSGSGATVGDAVRIESKARYNDGRLVRSLKIQPLDGIILVNEK